MPAYMSQSLADQLSNHGAGPAETPVSFEDTLTETVMAEPQRISSKRAIPPGAEVFQRFEGQRRRFIAPRPIREQCWRAFNNRRRMRPLQAAKSYGGARQTGAVVPASFRSMRIAVVI